jgi:hypothetical protein
MPRKSRCPRLAVPKSRSRTLPMISSNVVCGPLQHPHRSECCADRASAPRTQAQAALIVCELRVADSAPKNILDRSTVD